MTVAMSLLCGIALHEQCSGWRRPIGGPITACGCPCHHLVELGEEDGA